MISRLILVVCLCDMAICYSLYHIYYNPMEGERRIMGGKLIDIREHPYIVSLQMRGITGSCWHVCGASIINTKWLLTAAHCVCVKRTNVKINPRYFCVLAGASRLGPNYFNGQIIRVRYISVHKTYDSIYMYNDIAVVKLEKDLEFGTTVSPIQFANELNENSSCIAMGWGQTFEQSAGMESLKHVTQTVLAKDLCSKRLNKGYPLSETQMCTETTNQETPCQGDSGGPLMCNGKQVAIVSWSLGCRTQGHPGIHTMIIKYDGWINGKIAHDCQNRLVNNTLFLHHLIIIISFMKLFRISF